MFCVCNLSTSGVYTGPARANARGRRQASESRGDRASAGRPVSAGAIDCSDAIDVTASFVSCSSWAGGRGVVTWPWDGPSTGRLTRGRGRGRGSPHVEAPTPSSCADVSSQAQTSISCITQASKLKHRRQNHRPAIRASHLHQYLAKKILHVA
jgi:hypothetical protein